MTDRDTPYFELRDALVAGGCPLCRLGDRAATRLIESALYEGMTDPSVRNRFRAAQGLCRRHAWEMTRKRATVLGTAIVYRDVISDLATALEAAVNTGSRSGWARRARPSLPAPTEPCPACAVAEDEATRAGSVLRQHLGDPEIARAYQSAGGLCLAHFREVLHRAHRQEAETLERWQLEVYRALRDQLDELIRKHDHRFRQEPMGAEADAWLRAVSRVVGERDPESP